MTKKNNGEITPDNFLDAYKPVSPQRKGDRGTSEEKAELTTVEKAQSNEREAESIVLQSRNNDVEMTPLAYQEIFLRPNLGESMRYGKTYYVSRDDCKKSRLLCAASEKATTASLCRFSFTICLNTILPNSQG